MSLIGRAHIFWNNVARTVNLFVGLEVLGAHFTKLPQPLMLNNLSAVAGQKKKKKIAFIIDISY